MPKVKLTIMDRRGQKCSMQDVRMGAEFVFMEKWWKTDNFRFMAFFTQVNMDGAKKMTVMMGGEVWSMC